MKKSKNEKEKKKDSSRKVTAPLTKSKIIRSGLPRFQGNRNSIVIHHREFVRDVSTSVGVNSLKVEFLEINPGLGGSFPWLSGLAPNFESYKFRSLTFEYVPYCASTTVGTLMLAVDWDVSDYEPTSKQQMMSYQTSTSAPMWETVRLKCEPSNLKKFSLDHFIRVIDPGQVDLKTYDVGCFYFATDNNAVASQPIGSLFVEYEVELITPQIQADDPYRSSGQVVSTLASKENPFPSATTTVYADEYDPVINRVSDSQVGFKKAGQYLLEWALGGAGLTTDYPTLVFGDGEANHAYNLRNLVNGTGTASTITSLVNLTKPDFGTFQAPAGWAALQTVGLRVAPYATSYI